MTTVECSGETGFSAEKCIPSVKNTLDLSLIVSLYFSVMEACEDAVGNQIDNTKNTKR